MRSKIREDIGDFKFCVIVDESRDESKREQLALVLRFVDNDGLYKNASLIFLMLKTLQH